ncbi:MAG: DUF58 domain-containing protein [Planctomycetota bacterium]
MATARDASQDKSRLNAVLTTDFCPWANRFVYWLKEPVGWFVLATVASIIVGRHIGPVGWMLAGALTFMIAVGMAWPWIAVRVVTCSMNPAVDHVHEGDTCDLILTARNRLMFPVWGLAVEGYLDRSSEDAEAVTRPTAALASVPGWSVSDYRFSIQPELRGRYPDGHAKLTCSFPFGIWTAKIPLEDIAPVTVWPRVYRVDGQPEFDGQQATEKGDGRRAGQTGDYVGVREYRRGDRLQQVNWIATAKADRLIVTERGVAPTPAMSLIVDVSSASKRGILSDRIRVAASVLSNLHAARIPTRLLMGGRCISMGTGHDGYARCMDALALVPMDGEPESSMCLPAHGEPSISITSNQNGNPIVYTSITSTHEIRRTAKVECEHGIEHRVLDRSNDLSAQLWALWTEARDVARSA